ncbi:ATP-dependent metallopeptidase FtsH/Yme1/Tma family protein [Paraflavitalea speifideaquila]|uniref:ATP-dependent metallopeptidase FtsH/Yme1/Tma family protein n=1 Tax=Paraflavitalea speifideaquila TaxID=3076558 RepID=UPI0028E97055|nr:ATP-dependent metallopeptidase FtsH/Yme1/Tma family protein [Paraflavitalea speifideiaquila]
MYWVWAIIFAVLVAFQLFGSFAPDAKEIDELEFYQMLEKGDIDKLTTVTNKNLIRITLTQAGYQKYKDQLSKKWPGVSEKGPHFEFRVIKAEEFKRS